LKNSPFCDIGVAASETLVRWITDATEVRTESGGGPKLLGVLIRREKSRLWLVKKVHE